MSNGTYATSGSAVILYDQPGVASTHAGQSGVQFPLSQDASNYARINTTIGADTNPSAPWTIEAWFNLMTDTLGLYRIFDSINTTTKRGFTMYVSNNGVNHRLAGFVGDGTNAGIASTGVSGTTNITTNQMHHAVMRHDGTTLELFLDGVSQGTRTIGYLGNGSDSLRLANAQDVTVSQGFRGVLDELAIYDDDLSNARILAHFEAGRGNWEHYDPA